MKQSESRSHDKKNHARDEQAAAGGENLCRCGIRIHIVSSRTQSPGSQYASEEGEKIRKKRYGGKAVCAHKDAHQSVAEDPFREEGEQKSHKADGEPQRAGPQTFFHPWPAEAAEQKQHAQGQENGSPARNPQNSQQVFDRGKNGSLIDEDLIQEADGVEKQD